MTERAVLTSSRLLGLLAAAALVEFAAIVAALGVGAGDVGGLAWLRGETLDPVAHAILFDVRGPRVLVAAVLGGALATAGVAFQALLRNPLADPYVLGVSGGASLGGVLAITLGAGTVGVLGGVMQPLSAFLGALAALVLIEKIATINGRLSIYSILLTGVIFNAFAGAVIFFIQSVASLDQLHQIVFYLMGRVPALGSAETGALAGVCLLVTLVLFALARSFNALALGEEGAAGLGVDVERVKRLTFVLGSLLTGLSVAAAGMIGFVGLIVPHLLRLAFGPDHRLLVPLAFFAGGAFLVLADLVARVAIAPNELPVGVVTALLGGPFFLFLLRRRARRFEVA